LKLKIPIGHAISGRIWILKPVPSVQQDNIVALASKLNENYGGSTTSSPIIDPAEPMERAPH
jgi:hypothetical protein